MFLEPLEDRRLLALTITVNSAADTESPDNVLTFREAIEVSNGTLGLGALTNTERQQVVVDGNTTNSIAFSISSAGGLQTITPDTPLPTITNPVTIDGSTEPGAFLNTQTIDDPDPSLRGFNGKLQIEINGANLTGANGLTIAAPNGIVKVRGLVINRFHGNGGPDQGNGILVQAPGGVFLSGNFIGVDSTGNTGLGNDRGIFVNAGNTTIGGTTPGDRNVISGNNLHGIQIAVGGNTVQGNFIGTSSSGKSGAPNGGDGILVGSPANTIGGTGGGRNVISGNKTNGIDLVNATSTTIQNNLIGTDVAGALAVGNQQIGIRLENASKTNISSNIVAFNGPATVNQSMSGIVVLSGVGNSIQGNSIFNNSNLGIDLAPFGPTANDPGDADSGSNNLQNFPEISSASLNMSSFALNYLLPSATGNSAYPLRVEFFKADSDNQEGQLFLAADTYDAANAGTTKVFTTSLAATTPLKAGDFVVATATDAAGNTSEFSPGIVVPPSTALHAPVATNSVTYINTQSTTGLVIMPDPADTANVRFFKIKGITSGTLFQNDGVTPIKDNDFISVSQAAAGLRFTPSQDFVGSGNFSVQESTNSSDAGLGGAPVQVVIDVIQPTVSVAVSPSAVGEDAGLFLVYTFTRTDDSSLPLTIGIHVDGTADPGNDYGLAPGSADILLQPGDGTLTFDPGNSTETVILKPLSDSLVEGDENAQLSLLNGSTYVVSSGGASAAGTIQDADAATIAFEIDSQTVLEGTGPLPQRIILTMEPGNSLASSASFMVSAQNFGTSDSDYNAAAFPQTFIIPAGSGNGAVFTAMLTPNLDNLVEQDEELALPLTVLSGPISRGPGSTQEDTIQDGDKATFSIGSLPIQEGGAATFIVTLSTPIDSDATLNISFSDITTSTNDFDHSSRQITFPANSTTPQAITIAITDDGTVERSEGFLASLALDVTTPLTGYSTDLSSTSNATILDNDIATFLVSDAQIQEGAGKLAFVVSLSAPIDVDAAVDVSFGDVSTSGGDFDHTVQQVLFSAGSTAPQTILVAVTDDVIVEKTETLTARMSLDASTPLDEYGFDTSDTGTGTINDNDTAKFSISDKSIKEGAGQLVFLVTLTNPIDVATQVNVSLTDIETSSQDFNHAIVSVVFPANSTSDQPVTVTINDDTIVEASERFTTHLALDGSTPLTDYSSDATSTSIGTILDNDSAVFTIGDATVTEGGGGLTFKVSLSAPIDTATKVNVSFGDIDTSNGDFDHSLKQVIFPANSTADQTFTVSVLDDNVVEKSEKLTAGLALDSSTLLNGYATDLTDKGAGTIDDNDRAQFVISGDTKKEGSGPLALVVTLSNPIDVDALVNVTFTDGKTSTGDFDHSLKQASFPAGSTAGQTITVAVLDDGTVENTEDFTASLSLDSKTPLTGYSTDLSGTAIGKILDNDTAVFQIDDVPASEGSGTLVFHVFLSTPIDTTVKVNVSFADGKTSAADFTHTTQTLTFAPNTNSPGIISVPVNDDSLVEGNESFTASLALDASTPLSGYSTDLTDAGIGTILDNDIDLQVTATESVDPVIPGSGPGNLTYVVTVSNLGATDATGLLLSENLKFPAGVVIASIAPSGTTKYDPPGGASGIWTVGNLSSKQSEKLTIVLTVPAGAPVGADTITSATTVTASTENRVNALDDTTTIATSVGAKELDFGDAPDSYHTLLANDGARHTLGSGLFLGKGVDADKNGQPGTTASGDDSSGTDDEEGVTLPSVTLVGMQASAQVVASAPGKLDAWIDFNRNGVFDTADRIAASIPLVAGMNNVTFVVPATASLGATYARFRISSAGGLGPSGLAADGEVEDYALTLMAPAAGTASLVPDPMNPGKKILVAMGGSGNDTIEIQLQKNTILLCKNGCKITTFTLAQVGRVVLFGSGGNDTLKMPTNVNRPFEVYGGAGNDTITGGIGDDVLDGGLGNDRIYGGGGKDLLRGGGGNDYLDGGAADDLLLGGDGADQLLGGAGRDVLIGGTGADKLSGQQDDDLLVGGSTTLDANDAALAAVVAEWRSADDFAMRIAKLSGTLDASTLMDDKTKDQLNAVGGRNWFIDFASPDALTSFNADPVKGDRKN